MRESELPVKFEPQGKTVFVLHGTTVVEAAARAGISMNMPCGGQGTCGKCRVRLVSGACEPRDAERGLLTQADIEDGVRLACQTCICAPMAVEVPETSVLTSTFQILGGASGIARARLMDVSDVAVRKRFVELPAPSREDETPDIDRLERAVGPFYLELDLLRQMPQRLRQWQFHGTAVLADHRLIDFEEADTTSEVYAAAFDIGTTTLVGTLIDLTTGRECATVLRINPQTSYGDDVVARINLVRQDPAGLDKLHRAIIGEVNSMLAELCAEAKADVHHVYEATFAGNTTMQHLLEGVDPSALGEVPFVPATGRALMLHARELGINIHPRGRVYIFPVIGGFVGGDTTAGIMATRLADATGATVLVDIGTNGEIVVSHGGRMVATSTAAGPAFEGARITFGMRATNGAIEKVLFDGDVRTNVIGGVAPVGLCGSALVDVVAEMLRHGLLMSEGLMLLPDQVPDTVPGPLRERVIIAPEGTAFVLATSAESATGSPVYVTQKDIRELQLATAAIRAGFSILLRRVGLTVGDVDQVLIAGGFGNFIRRSNAQRIGLLPADLERRRISFVGNTSLAGARLAAASQKIRHRAEEIAREIEHVDLSIDPEFQEQYVEAMFFPEEG